MSDGPIRAVLLDLEGTLFARGKALPRAAAAVSALREQGLGVRFMTNIDSRSPAEVASQLAGCGLDVPVAELFTPVSAAQAFFASVSGPRVAALISNVLQDEFANLVRETVADGRTVFLSSHELDEVQRVVDRLAIIKDGRIVVTDTVEGLRRAAPRTVELTFAQHVDPGRFAGLDGVRVLHSTDRRIALSITGPVAPLLRVAADLDPTDITARPADLDELFLTYYRTDSSAAVADVS